MGKSIRKWEKSNRKNKEKTIGLLDEEKKDINKTNKEIIRMRQTTKEKLNKEFIDIQERNAKQREKIETKKKIK